MPEYAQSNSLESFSTKSQETEPYRNYFNEFNSVFDAAPLGVYLGGMDSNFHTRANSVPGKIDLFCVFNPSYFKYYWKEDLEGRRIPFLVYNEQEVAIINLHITNKKMMPSFYSLSPLGDR